MNASWRRLQVVLWMLLLTLTYGVPSAHARIEVATGNDPVQGEKNWPAGAVDLANLEKRLGYWVGPPLGGGEYHFEYRGGTADFQQALDLLSKIDAPERLVVVHEGPATSSFLEEKKDGKTKARYDWGFVIWDKKTYEQLYHNKKSGDFLARDPNFRKPMPPPRIDVYIGSAPAGEGVDWSAVTLPKNVKVQDERASANGYPADAGSVLRGRISDLTTDKPVAGARLVVTKWDVEKQMHEDVIAAIADADGKFAAMRVPPGESYQLHVEAKDYAPRLVGYASFGKDTLKDFPDVQIAPAATIAGVLATTDGKKIANVKVFASDIIGPDGSGYRGPKEEPTVTDAEGRFALTTVPTGTCRLIVQAPGYYAVEPMKKFTIPSKRIELRFKATGNVHIKVTVAGGAPEVPYLTEITPEGGNKVGSWGGSANVAADGTFKFENVPPGKYTVTARPNPGRDVKGKDPNEKAIEVKPGVTLDVEIAVK